jgi:hypothetical protein
VPASTRRRWLVIEFGPGRGEGFESLRAHHPRSPQAEDRSITPHIIPAQTLQVASDFGPYRALDIRGDKAPPTRAIPGNEERPLPLPVGPTRDPPRCVDMGVILGVFGGRWVAGKGLLVMVPSGPEKDACMSWSPCLVRSDASKGRVSLKLGHRLVDEFLAFADARC